MMGISPFNHEAKILFHTDFYFYLDTLQKLQDNVSEEDLESLSEMACDDEVALFLSRDAKSQYNFLSLLIKSNSSWRIKELTLCILCNMMRMDFSSFKDEEMCISVPTAIISDYSENFQQYSAENDLYCIPALVAIFQYLTMFNDQLMQLELDEESDQFKHNFELIPNVLMLMASTLDPDLLGKSSRYLFSIVDLASVLQEPLSYIGMFLNSPQPLGLMNEALKQSLEFQDSKSSFVIIETISNVFDFLEEETVLEKEHSDQLCETLLNHLKTQDGDLELELSSVTSCAKICSRLWTSTCHLQSFEQIAKIYLNNTRQDNQADNTTDQDNEVMLDVIKKCLKHFINVHSQTLMSDSDILQSPIIQNIVQILAFPE